MDGGGCPGRHIAARETSDRFVGGRVVSERKSGTRRELHSPVRSSARMPTLLIATPRYTSDRVLASAVASANRSSSRNPRLRARLFRQIAMLGPGRHIGALVGYLADNPMCRARRAPVRAVVIPDHG